MIYRLSSTDDFMLLAAEGSTLSVTGSVDLCMNISGLCICHTVYVTDNLHSEQVLLRTN